MTTTTMSLAALAATVLTDRLARARVDVAATAALPACKAGRSVLTFVGEASAAEVEWDAIREANRREVDAGLRTVRTTCRSFCRRGAR